MYAGCLVWEMAVQRMESPRVIPDLWQLCEILMEHGKFQQADNCVLCGEGMRDGQSGCVDVVSRLIRTRHQLVCGLPQS